MLAPSLRGRISTPVMLHINELTYRIEGRPILEAATVAVPSGHKVGLVGRNGSGKTTLLRLLAGEIAPDDGAVTMSRHARIGYVAQEAPGGEESLIDWVLATDTERHMLLAEAETASDPARIADIHVRLADIDAHAAPARAAQILAGLGFDHAAQQQPCRAFSGGWRMRLALASVLFLEPDILLLDEPTNYLDLEGTIWLENYLRTYPQTVLIVSHDRDLLNRVVGAIVHLERGRLTLYQGGYDDFEETRRARQRLDLKLKKKQDDERRRLEAFVARFSASASKAPQAQSRLKMLAKMQPIAAAVDEGVAPFIFPNPQRKIASPLLRLENASVGYEPGMPVLDGLNLRIDRDDRIALLGANGNGKSTFAKLIAGRLPPMAGSVFGAGRVDVAYFAQHQVDDLLPAKTPYAYMCDLLPDATEAQRRARLGTYGFGIAKADTPSEHLSGGEKARLLMMLTTFSGPHVLILDEPTNHLDIDSRQALIECLNEYEGAVILISHDRHLVEASADRLWIVRDGTVQPFGGDMDGYRQLLLEERTNRAREERAAQKDTTRTLSAADIRKAAAERRQQLAPLKKRMTAAEETVNRLAAEIAALDARLADETLYVKKPDEAREIVRRRGELAKAIGDAETAWLEATEAYETTLASVEQATG
ncbi:MAG: hypothetical protein RLZ98_2179 [Pseudomonadota bacterium]|jgi:ATP-binding cassette subfamily F protein 3